MCISSVKKVLRILPDKAEMEDGRIVTLGGIGQIAPGDYLEVYADLAVTKVPSGDAHRIISSRKGRSRL